MKLLITIPSLNPELGGPSEVAIQTARALIENGLDVEIATTNDRGTEVFEYADGILVDYRDVPVRFFNRSQFRRNEFIPSYSFARWINGAIQNYDLVETNYVFCFSTTIASFAAHRRSVPYVVRTLGQLGPWSLAQSPRLKRVYSALIERRTLQHAKAIRVTSMGEAADVARFGINTPCIVEPHGVVQGASIENAQEKLRAYFDVPKECTVLLFLSRLHYKKRPELLIEAMHALDQEGVAPLFLILAGTGDAKYLHQLRQSIYARGLQDRIILPGFVSGDEKQLLLQGADIFALPSYQENFGVAVAEALAAGLPVVISDEIQIAAEIADNRAGTVISPSVETLAQSLKELVEDPERRESYSRAGRDLARRRYSWDAVGKALAEHYRSLV